MTYPLDPDQMSARDGLRLLVEQFVATPGVVVGPIFAWVVVPMLVLAAGVWAVLTLVGRHPDAALPPVDEPGPELQDDGSLIGEILAGRTSSDDDTVPIGVGR